jgi:hypothetical protein
MKIGALPLVFFVLLVTPATALINRYFPADQQNTATMIASAVVAILGALSSAIWIVYGRKLSRLGVQAPAGASSTMPAADVAPAAAASQATSQATSQPFIVQWLLG